MNAILSLFAAFSVAIMPFAQLDAADASLDDFYLSTATELAQEIDENATGKWLDYMGFDDDLDAQIRAYGSAACHEPDHILVMEFDADLVLDKGMEEGWYLSPNLTEQEHAILCERYGANDVLMGILMTTGSVTLMIASVVKANRSYFAPENWGDDAIVLLTKDGADFCIACTYSVSGDGILAVEVMYIPAELDGHSIADELADQTGEAFREIEIH